MCPRPMAYASTPAVPTIGGDVAAVAVSVVVSLVLAFAVPLIVSGLPRPLSGESVSVPWPLCVVVQLALPILLSWALSFAFIRRRRVRWLSLVVLVACVLCWCYPAGGLVLLSKAWR